MRFDVLDARRRALAPFDEARHADAENRHDALLRRARESRRSTNERRAAKSGAAGADRAARARRADASMRAHEERRRAALAERVGRLRAREDAHRRFVAGPEHARQLQQHQKRARELGEGACGAARPGVWALAVPQRIVPADNAAHFPRAREYFEAAGLGAYNANRDELPLQREEAIRFAAVGDRRGAVAPHEEARHAEAEARRRALITGRRSTLGQAGAERAARANRAREARSARRFVEVAHVPATVRPCDVERHFPRAAAAMAEFGRAADDGGALPAEEAAQQRFSRVPARRAGVLAHDELLHQRAEANREGQAAARMAELRCADRRRDDAHRRVRDRTAAIDRASRERMLTAEGRRRAILEARAASLRGAGENRAARGRQALAERRMVEHGFVPPFADVTVVTAVHPYPGGPAIPAAQRASTSAVAPSLSAMPVFAAAEPQQAQASTSHRVAAAPAMPAPRADSAAADRARSLVQAPAPAAASPKHWEQPGPARESKAPSRRMCC